jgi:nicotinate-nucleotide adenylyltransferase
VDTLTYLAEKYPQHQFSIIMGGDSFSNIKRWKNYEVLLKNYSIYIYERPGFKTPEPQNSNITVLHAPLLEISSTHIRELVHLKKSIRYLVPDIVQAEIEQHQYYQ